MTDLEVGHQFDRLLRNTLISAIDKKIPVDEVEAIILQGAEVNYDYAEPIMVKAARNGNVDTIALLQRYGAKVNASHLGMTGLHIAAQNNNVDCVKALINNGALVDPKNFMGETPLHLAAKSNHIPIMDYLVNSGADINVQNDKGHTACHIASNCIATQSMAWLLDKGADTDIEDIDGRNVMAIAKELGIQSTIQLLEAHHQKTELTDIIVKNNKENQGLRF